MLTAGWDTPLGLLRLEVIQRAYEGGVVTDELKARIAALDNDEPWNADAIEPLWDELAACETDSAFPFVQPNDLEAIRAERP